VSDLNNTTIMVSVKKVWKTKIVEVVYCSSMEKKQEMDFNFELPQAEGAKVVKPRVHFAGESTCVSCEG